MKTNRIPTHLLYVLALGALVCALVCLSALRADMAHASTPSATCMEDEPCWTWSTMGSMSRGVAVRKGAPIVGHAHPTRKGWRVVDPCEFAYMSHAGYIDWRRSPRLKGDGYALANGCNP